MSFHATLSYIFPRGSKVITVHAGVHVHMCLSGLKCFTNKSKEAVVFLCLRKVMDDGVIINSFTTDLNGKFRQVMVPFVS